MPTSGCAPCWRVHDESSWRHSRHSLMARSAGFMFGGRYILGFRWLSCTFGDWGRSFKTCSSNLGIWTRSQTEEKQKNLGWWYNFLPKILHFRHFRGEMGGKQQKFVIKWKLNKVNGDQSLYEPPIKVWSTPKIKPPETLEIPTNGWDLDLGGGVPLQRALSRSPEKKGLNGWMDRPETPFCPPPQVTTPQQQIDQKRKEDEPPKSGSGMRHHFKMIHPHPMQKVSGKVCRDERTRKREILNFENQSSIWKSKHQKTYD